MGNSRSMGARGTRICNVAETRRSLEILTGTLSGSDPGVTKKICRPNGALPKDRRSCEHAGRWGVYQWRIT